MYFYVKKEGKGKEREKYFIVNIRFLLTPFRRFCEYSSLHVSHSLG